MVLIQMMKCTKIFSSVAKGFLYLQDIDSNNAPFEYLEGSMQMQNLDQKKLIKQF